MFLLKRDNVICCMLEIQQNLLEIYVRNLAKCRMMGKKMMISCVFQVLEIF